MEKARQRKDLFCNHGSMTLFRFWTSFAVTNLDVGLLIYNLISMPIQAGEAVSTNVFYWAGSDCACRLSGDPCEFAVMCPTDVPLHPAVRSMLAISSFWAIPLIGLMLWPLFKSDFQIDQIGFYLQSLKIRRHPWVRLLKYLVWAYLIAGLITAMIYIKMYQGNGMSGVALNILSIFLQTRDLFSEIPKIASPTAQAPDFPAFSKYLDILTLFLENEHLAHHNATSAPPGETAPVEIHATMFKTAMA